MLRDTTQRVPLTKFRVIMVKWEKGIIICECDEPCETLPCKCRRPCDPTVPFNLPPGFSPIPKPLLYLCSERSCWKIATTFKPLTIENGITTSVTKICTQHAIEAVADACPWEFRELAHLL